MYGFLAVLSVKMEAFTYLVFSTIYFEQKRSWNLKDPVTWGHPATPWTPAGKAKKDTGKFYCNFLTYYFLQMTFLS